MNTIRHVLCATGASLICMLPALAAAECSSGICTDVYVEELYIPTDSSGVYIQTSGTETLAGCTPYNGIYLLLQPAPTSAQFKEVYATLLAAQMNDKRVSIRINNGSNPCTVAYILLPRQ